MKIIPLTRNKFAIVDDVDYIHLSRHKWYATDQGYARREIYINKKKVIVHMHRVIMNAPDDMFVDHINGYRNDNRRKNLRLCTHLENNRNSFVRFTNNSGYKGVAFHRQSGLYHASININGKQISLQYYKTAQEAAKAYNEAAQKYFGEFAKLNDI